MRCVRVGLGLVLATVVLVPSAAAAGGDPVLCFDDEATIVGTEGPDVIEGTAENDVIVGLGGNDHISGLIGNDHVCGGDGDDIMLGVGAFSYAFGGPGNDWIEASGSGSGNAFSQVFYGEDGDDVLIASDSDLVSYLDGGRGNDRLMGGPSRDRLVPGPGRDTIDGGAGEPNVITYQHFPGPVSVDLRRGIARGEGRDSITNVQNVTGTRGADRLIGDRGPNEFVGAAYRGNHEPDQIFGRGGDDELVGFGTISGGGGNDTVRSELDSDDRLNGGSGTDWFIYEEDYGPVAVNLAEGTASGPRIGNDVFLGFEKISATTASDTLIGDDADNTFMSFADQDHIEGGGGDDTIDSGYGSDTVFAGEGDDILNGNVGFDTLDGGPGTDVCTNGEMLTACEG